MRSSRRAEEKALFDQGGQERGAGLSIQPPETLGLRDRQLKARHLQVLAADPFNEPIGNRVRGVVLVVDLVYVPHACSVARPDGARHLGPSLGGQIRVHAQHFDGESGFTRVRMT